MLLTETACISSCPDEPSCRIDHVMAHVGGESSRMVQGNHERLGWEILINRNQQTFLRVLTLFLPRGAQISSL